MRNDLVREFERKEKLKNLERIISECEKVNSHKYLRTKKIYNYPILLTKSGSILTPVYNIITNKLMSAQYIYPDGEKRFVSKLPINWGYAEAGYYSKDKIVYICEGYATAITINILTGYRTLAALSASNLIHVCNGLKKIKPHQEAIIASDNDISGVKAAEQASKYCGYKVVMPDDGMDFNDLFAIDKKKAENILKNI